MRGRAGASWTALRFALFGCTIAVGPLVVALIGAKGGARDDEARRAAQPSSRINLDGVL